jgi:hypothetical protein
MKPGIVAYACNPSNQETETGRSGVRVQPELYSSAFSITLQKVKVEDEPGDQHHNRHPSERKEGEYGQRRCEDREEAQGWLKNCAAGLHVEEGATSQGLPAAPESWIGQEYPQGPGLKA